MFRLCRGGSLSLFLVCLILQDFLDGLLLRRLFTFLCAGCGFPYPVADVPQLLQILLYLGQRCFQSCNFFQKRFLLLLQLLLGTVLIVRVLGKVGSGFRISGNLRVFLFEILLCFLEKYLLVLLIEPLKISRSISDRVDYPPIGLSCFSIISVSVRQFSPVSFLP